MSEALSARYRKPVVSFARRDGRLDDRRQRAWDRHHRDYVVDVPRALAHTSVAAGYRLDREREFGRDAPLVVEIGSGAGDCVVHAAKTRPDTDFLAVEVYRPGVAQTLAAINRHGVSNVRIVEADAMDVLRTMLPGTGASEIWVFFPDPWPKTRHRKRRLVTPAMAELVASALAPGGTWRLATDWPDYAEQMLEVGHGCDRLEDPYAGRLAPRFEGRPPTRFERKGLAAGRDIHDLAFERA